MPDIKFPSIRDLAQEITAKYKDMSLDREHKTALVVFEHGGHRLVTYQELAAFTHEEKDGQRVARKTFTPFLRSEFTPRDTHRTSREMAAWLLNNIRIDSDEPDSWVRPLPEFEVVPNHVTPNGGAILCKNCNQAVEAGKEREHKCPKHGDQVVLGNNLVACYVKGDYENPEHLVNLPYGAWAVFEKDTLTRRDVLEQGYTLEQAKAYARHWS